MPLNILMSTKKVLSPNINVMFNHHTYLLTGNLGYWSEILITELKKIFQTDNLTSSPDIWWQNYESFGIKEAHALIEREVCHGFGEQGRFFILEVSAITPEAQNALLKTFEEPVGDVHFFIIARSADIFLPTLRSRMIVLNQ